MQHDFYSGGDVLTSSDVAVVYIWCKDKGVADRINALLQASLSRATITLLDTDPSNEWDPIDTHCLLISDDIQYALRIEKWLIENPDQHASLLFIVPEEAAMEKSLDNLQRYKGVQRLEKKNLHLCDTLARGLLYAALDEHLQSLESSQKQTDVLIDHVKGQLSVFYHNINNPLTVLSGNLQLLHILTESSTLPNDVQKCIQDINEISDRFESDLKIISELRDKIHEQD